MKDLLEDAKKLFHTADQYKNQEATHAAVIMQKLKTQIQQLQYSLNAEELNLKQSEDNGGQTKTKEDLEEEASRKKVNLFFETWIQYIVTHHLVQIVRSSFEKTQIRSLID